MSETISSAPPNPSMVLLESVSEEGELFKFIQCPAHAFKDNEGNMMEMMSGWIIMSNLLLSCFFFEWYVSPTWECLSF